MPSPLRRLLPVLKMHERPEVERSVNANRSPVIVVALLSLMLMGLSVRQLIRGTRPVAYLGMPAMSELWLAPPAPEGRWQVSDRFQAPPAGANREELLAWLRERYPVLTLDLEADIHEGGEREIDLGGGPPRRLYVVPGEGLVMREP